MIRAFARFRDRRFVQKSRNFRLYHRKRMPNRSKPTDIREEEV